jgi:hypothetical protein
MISRRRTLSRHRDLGPVQRGFHQGADAREVQRRPTLEADVAHAVPVAAKESLRVRQSRTPEKTQRDPIGVRGE